MGKLSLALPSPPAWPAADTSWPQQANCTADIQNFMKKLAWAETAMPTEGILAALEICFVTERQHGCRKLRGNRLLSPHSVGFGEVLL